MNRTVYLDNAATSWPKPETVIRAALEAMRSPLGNPGRSASFAALDAAMTVYRTRALLAGLFGTLPERAVFTLNTTHALNLALSGLAALLPTGKRTVVTDVFAHNSVLRPLRALERSGAIKLYVCPGGRDPREYIDAGVGMGVFSAKSNVTGELFDVSSIGGALRDNGSFFVCDAAQAAGSVPLDMRSMKIDALCLPGHKGLMGPTGTGALLLGEGCPLFEPLMSGGSGNASMSPLMPREAPERYEAGTLNTVGIAALLAGLEFVRETGAENIGAHERLLSDTLGRLVESDGRVRLFSAQNGVVLLNREGVPSHELESRLSSLGICSRSGFHCAPLAHSYLNTGADGALRLSFGPFNTTSDAEAAARAVLGELG